MRYLKETESIYYKYPQLASEWDYERNYPLVPQEVTQGSEKKVWWKCPNGHSYDMAVYNRTAGGQNCPFCSNKRLLTGYNDLATINPTLAYEWDFDNNDDLLPSQVLPNSDRVVWWKCPKGHSYDMRIASRNHGNYGCPFCAGKRILPGFNDLESQAPKVAKEWDYVKNAPLTPGNITAKSSKKTWWICDKGHSYQAVTSDRTREDGKATGCPYCNGKKAITGENDLQTKYPEIAKEWDIAKNTLLPSEVLPFSMKQAWWTCSLGHSYKMQIYRRSSGQNCPYCANMQVLTGYNDLSTLFPEIATEWDFEQNTKTPDKIIPGSHAKAHWICSKCGNRWEAPIKGRTYSGTGCPKCAFIFHTSFNEQALFYYISKIWPDAKNSYHPNYLASKEIDIYVPSKKLAIEYDGGNWHSNVEKDKEKSKLILSNENKFVRIREDKAPDIEDGSKKFYVKSGNDESAFESTLKEIISWIQDEYKISNVPTVNLFEDKFEIQASYKRKTYGQSVASNENMMLEWNFEKNYPLTPDCVPNASHDTYWWICSKCGNEWQQSPHTKRRGKLGCISCIAKERNVLASSNRVRDKKTKTLDQYPELLEEWDWETNKDLNPYILTYGSEKKVGWICKKCGNTFDMIIKNRTIQHQKCPQCSRKAGADKRRNK